MIEILSNKNLTTRFQILVEIASSQPNIQQKDIAGRLGITPQAVSDYIHQLGKDNLIISEGRTHKVSPIGIDWMIQQLNEAKEYFKSVERVIWNVRLTSALAECEIKKGQSVGLKMKAGLLYAGENTGSGASGLAVTAARRDEVVGVTDIRGIIEMKTGMVTVYEVPGVQKGRPDRMNLNKIKKHLDKSRPLAYLGIEAFAVLKKMNCQPSIDFAGTEAMIEAVRRGISPVIFCVDEEISVLTKRLEDAGVQYQLVSSFPKSDSENNPAVSSPD